MFKKCSVLLLVVGILSLGFIMGGCGKGEETTPTTTTTTPTTTTTTTPTTTSTTTTTVPIGGVEYFPHEDGYSWAYKHPPPPISSTTMEVQTLDGTITIPGTSIEVQRLRKLLYSETGSTTEGECYRRVDANGAYDHACGTPTSEGMTMLKFPIIIGDSWTDTVGVLTVTGEVVSYEVVTVLAGTFDAYKVKFTHTAGGSSSYGYVWYGKNAGFIKSYDPSSDATFELIYKNFQL